MKAWMTMCCAAIALALPAAAAEKKPAAAKKTEKKKRVKYEKLACKIGTEDEQARIAVLLADGKVESFAYYSKWKPRTCSMDVKRDDAFSKWEDHGSTTTVTLTEDKGAFLIDNSPGRYHFIFRDIDRMRYCGMEGKVSGTLTITRGKPQCQVTGVMDREAVTADAPAPASAGVPASAAAAPSTVPATAVAPASAPAPAPASAPVPAATPAPASSPAPAAAPATAAAPIPAAPEAASAPAAAPAPASAPAPPPPNPAAGGKP